MAPSSGRATRHPTPARRSRTGASRARRLWLATSSSRPLPDRSPLTIVATGKPRWFGPKDGWGYSSPQLATIDGVAQIVLVNGPGVIGVSPSDGTVLWKHAWGGDSIVQPAVLAGGDLLIGSGSGLAANSGMLRVNVAHASRADGS